MKKILLITLIIGVFFSQHAESNETMEGNQLNTINVTAQKTEENVQDVPISMTVLDSLEIEDRKIEKVTDIALATPSLSFVNMNYSGWTFPVMRGLGSNWTLASSTTMFVDGIPV